jgi:hypothetical protein
MATKENLKIPAEIQKLMIAYGKESIYYVNGQWFFEINSAETTAEQTQTKVKEVKIKN